MEQYRRASSCVHKHPEWANLFSVRFNNNYIMLDLKELSFQQCLVPWTAIEWLLYPICRWNFLHARPTPIACSSTNATHWMFWFSLACHRTWPFSSNFDPNNCDHDSLLACYWITFDIYFQQVYSPSHSFTTESMNIIIEKLMGWLKNNFQK